MITNAFRKAFDGCNRTLESVLNSSRFAQEKARVESLQMLDSKSDLGIAHRSGALTMTELLHQMPEGLALKAATKRSGVGQVDSDLFALSSILGKEIIREAGNCLTEEMLEAAKEWPHAKPKRQLEITHWLLQTFQSESQGGISEKLDRKATYEGVFAKRERHLRDVFDLSLDPVLPALYGKWNSKTSKANCQGKSQMVAAFAQKAGARCLAVHPAVHHHDISKRFISRILNLIDRDMSGRGLYGTDAGLDEGIGSSMQECMFDAMDSCFHIGCALELSDGQWVMLDAHGRSWGIFPKHWGVPSVYRLVRKYQSVIPGLVVQRQDRGEAHVALEEVSTKVEHFLERSRCCENDFKQVGSLTELASYIERSADLNLLSDFIGVSGKGWLECPTRRSILAMSLAVGVGDTDLFDLPMKLIALEGDHEYLAHKKRSWLTAFHAAAHSEVCSMLNRAELIHPVIDFAEVSWAISVAALNSCLFEIQGRRPWSTHEFLLRLSADQTTLHNALRQYRSEDCELALAARQCLSAYPVKHALCERFVRL